MRAWELAVFLELRSQKTVLGIHKCPPTNILTYFRAKWRLLFSKFTTKPLQNIRNKSHEYFEA